MKKTYITYFTLLMAVFIISCDIKKNEVVLGEQFVRIYDNEAFGKEFRPLSVVQLSDGNFFILGETQDEAASQFPLIYTMIVDADGEFVSQQTLSNETVSPMANLMQSGTEFYFFAMNSVSLAPKLMQVGASGEVSEAAEITGLTYPLHASQDTDGSFLLLTYNNVDLESVFSKINTSGAVLASQSYTINNGEEDPSAEISIIKHLNKKGKQLPFLTGVMTGGKYYFNGFFNYNLSLVFLAFGDSEDNRPNLLEGYRDEECISALLHLSGNNFAVTRYASGNNYIIPKGVIDATSADGEGDGALNSTKNLGGNPIPEMTADARVILKKAQINGRNVLIYGTDTKGKQMVLYIYDESTGEFIHAKYLGFGNPYEMGGFTFTADGGIAVTGTTYIAGRFPRVCLFKLSPAEVSEMVRE
jgi:hypothetical protein